MNLAYRRLIDNTHPAAIIFLFQDENSVCFEYSKLVVGFYSVSEMACQLLSLGLALALIFLIGGHWTDARPQNPYYVEHGGGPEM